MSNSPLISRTILSPNRNSPRNHKIDTITIHCMAGNMSAVDCGRWFAKSSTRASSNYGIGSDGTIALYVPESDRSWATSSRTNDNRAVTIEVANLFNHEPYTISAKAEGALLNLVTDICRRNGIKKLVWSGNKADRVNHRNGCNMTVHRDYKNKSCPGNYMYSQMGRYAAEVNERLAGIKETGKTLWKVQTGAFQEKKNAESHKKWLEEQGVEAIIKEVGGMYKVQVGAYENIENARYMCNSLVSMGIGGYITT